MKMTKRILAFVLCFAMLLGMAPIFALRADAAGTLIDAAIFCSDVHNSANTVATVFSAIKSADSSFAPSTASFVGDTECQASSVTEQAQSVYSGIACYYAYGSHDSGCGIDDVTGVLYNGTNYAIYSISQSDMESYSKAQTASANFASDIAAVDASKPLFVISHMPLHARRSDNDGAGFWCDAINTAAASRDIVFFWAHNHTGENSTDTAAYYLAKGASITVEDDSSDSSDSSATSSKTLAFTYMNAGFIGKSAGRGGYVTTVKIYDDALVFQDYNSSGAVADNEYTHNVEVARKFAGTTDSGSTDESTPPTTEAPTTEEKEVYVLVDTLTNNGEYLIVNTNAAGDGYAMNHSSGTEGAVAVSIQESGDYIYIDLDDSTAVWTATTKSSGFELMNGSYYLEAYGSTSAIEISTTQAYSDRYWAYDSSASTLGYFGGSGDHYVYYDSGFVSAKNSGSEAVYIYEKQTITVSSDGTVSGGGSTEGGDSGDDDTTGGSTETVVGDGTYTTADDGSWQKVTFGTEGEQKTVYVLVDTITSGEEYLIVNTNSTGTGYGLGNSTSGDHAVDITSGELTVNGTSGTYIYIEDKGDALEWTATGSNSSVTFASGNYQLGTSGSGGSRTLTVSSSSSWVFTGSAMYYNGKNDYYVAYSSGTWGISSSNTSSRNVYLYQKVDIDTSSSVTYSVTASDIEHFYTADTTDTETAAITASVTDGAPEGTYSYEILSDEDSIISGDIASDGTITFNGAEGTAQVKVSYTWTEGENTYTIWQVIDVTATSPYYTIDLHKANVTYVEATGLTEFAEGTIYYTKNEDGTYTQVSGDAEFDSSVTYYTLSYTLGDEITAPIAIKGIEEGDRYGVWAVVKYYDGTTADGTDMGAVGDAIEWSSSDETIATVDKNTGIITFTGKEGTVQITATYLNGNKPSDTITISVTQSQYSVPSDGTNDFPEYPNEGAIRFDKTATAVGNFSETGIAMVELSMTGVPYTTGSEIDVVLMLDMTGSMTDDSMAAAEAAALAFAKQIILNEDDTYNNNRISIQVFNKNGVTELWAMSAVTADTYSSLVTAIESASDKQASGGTPYSTALSGCKDILDAARTDGTGNNRQQFCVFVSDGTPTSYTDVDGGSDTTKKEYYSSAMQEDGVTVYGVYTSAAAGSTDSNGGGSVNDTEEGTAIMQNVASSDDKVYTIDDYTDTSALTGVFTNIAMDILQAATDITVEDKITDEYTMIFDIPTDTNYNHTISTTQEFYIEFLKYTLDSNHERTDDVTSVTKLYLGVSNGTYYAASDASGTAYAAPVFAQSVIGEKGTLYYWTNDETYASKAAVTYTNSDDTYYFIPYGMEANEDGTAPDGWYNMTSGAYAYGTVDSVTNTSTDLVIATPYFVYNASTKMLYWTVDKLDTAEYALRYFLYLDNSATDVGENTEVPAATYPTNDHAYITYTNFRGNDCQQKFPIPQLTWNGAQVSYVFYLVNSAGQPINKSGQVVDFANAVFVTDVYTKAVVWNKGVDGSTGTGELSADWLADELLPDEYTIYDELAGFTLNVYEKADGTTIKNQFTIEGDTAANISSSLNTRLDLETTASTVSVVTTKVYNTKAGEKVTGYGTYYSTDTNMAGIDFSNVTVAFAVVWESKLVEDVVVVDYGLDVIINVVQNDLLQNTVSGIGVGNSAYGNIAMNTGVIATSQLGTAALTIDGNTISIENENAIRFHQGDMEFTAPVKFYYESPVKFYEDSEQKTGFMYSSVTVIPATTIYYEDSFLDLTSFTKGEDGTFTEDATSKWTTDGTVVNATQDQDRPGADQISKDLDADNNYGYDSAYEELATHSLDSAAKINVNAGTRGEATFTFYGTGFDVISMTSNTTGTLIVQLYSGASATGTAVKSLVVDTYYGYTQKDGNWVVSVNDPNALYQVPVMKMSGLTYGQYTVKIIAGYNSYFDNVDGSSDYDLYLDAVRIYDPTGVASGSTTNDTVSDAYVADGEGWPQYIELRNNIIAASNYTVTENEDGTVTVSGTNLAGAIFIDSSDATTSIADYVSYGPNNELYLAAGQSVSFALDQTNANIIADVQIAMKLGNGSSVTYEIYNAASDGTKSNTITGTLETATDLYYSIKDLASGTIVISNTSGGILSITNIKVTYTQNPYGTSTSSEADLDSGIMTTSLYVDEEVATAAVMSLRSMPVYEPEETVPEEPEPETTEPEVTEPETTVPEETEPETTVPEETEPETTIPEETEPDTSEQVEEIVKKVEEIIKKLFGWLFG